MIATLAVLAALALVGATAGSFSREWRRALLAHFRPHLAVACGAAALLVLAADLPAGPTLAMLMLLAASAAVHVREIRRAVPVGAPAAGGERQRIAFSNLLRENRQTHRVVEWVRREKVDVFIAAEAVDDWPTALAELTDELPHVASHPSGDVSIYARRPFAVEPRHLFATSGQAIVVEIDGITVLGVHTASPQMRALSQACDELVEAIGALVPTIPGPVVVIGDFNATPWSAPIRKLIADTGLAYGPGARIGSFPAALGRWNVPTWLALPIDLVLAGHGATVTTRRHGPRIGSDHWPVVAEIQYSRRLDPSDPRP